MKPRQQRMLAVGLAVAGLAIAAVLTLRAFEENLMFYIEISDVVNGDVPADRNFRVGGLVVQDSVIRKPGELEIEFKVTDLEAELTVLYSGLLPDLFREGQGIIAHGKLGDDGKFVADTVLAKHDENYMPPEVADSLAKHAANKAAQHAADEAAQHAADEAAQHAADEAAQHAADEAAQHAADEAANQAAATAATGTAE